jgi:predicted nucleic-acid-binding protein
MIALDTSLLARLLLQDDAGQYAKVKALLATRQVFTAPVTVMQELVWVLESRDHGNERVSAAMTLLLDLPNFKPEHVDELREALQNYREGMGFADALHLALSSKHQQFITFDKAFATQAKKLGLRPAVALA